MLFELLSNLWQCGDTPEHIRKDEPDIIVAITYGTRRDRIQEGTRLALVASIDYWKRFPKASIAFGNPDNCFRASSTFERAKKLEILRTSGVPEKCIIDAGILVNSITEAEAVQKALKDRGLKCQRILIVCTKIHSRSIRYIWGRLFPDTVLTLACLSGHPDIEAGHQILLQRNRWIWLCTNIARQLVIRIFGLGLAKKVVHIAAN